MDNTPDDSSSPAISGLRPSVEADGYGIIEDLPDSGLRITLHPPAKDDGVTVSLVCFVIGILSVAAGYYLRPGPGLLPHNPFPSAPYILIMLGCLNFGLAPLLFLIRLISGPTTNSVLEVWPGRIKADRTAGGDRMRSDYTLADVHCLFVDANMLFISVRKGELSLASFGKRDVNIAVALLIADRFWSGQELFHTTVTNVGVPRFIIGPKPEQSNPK